MALIQLQPSERESWRIVQAIISIITKWNATGTVTLRPGFTSTVVDKSVSVGAVNVGEGDVILLTPRTASAAASVASVFILSIFQGGFTISHNSSGAVDRTFDWAAR